MLAAPHDTRFNCSRVSAAFTFRTAHSIRPGGSRSATDIAKDAFEGWETEDVAEEGVEMGDVGDNNASASFADIPEDPQDAFGVGEGVVAA